VLYRFCDFSGAQAFRTNFDTLDMPVLVDLDGLDVGVPLAPRVAVRVRDVVAAHLAFTADFTFV